MLRDVIYGSIEHIVVVIVLLTIIKKNTSRNTCALQERVFGRRVTLHSGYRILESLKVNTQARVLE